jgi:hypothetical protein
MADFNNILPAGVDIQALELSSIQPTVRTQSLSGRIQTRSFGGQVWTMKIKMPPLDNEAIRAIYSFLMKQRGGLNTFTIAPANLKKIRGTQSATETLATGCSIGANSVTTSHSNEFANGDMFIFAGTAGHTKAYMVTNVSGTTLTFEPPAVSAVNSSDTIKSNTLFEMTVRLADDEIKYSETFNNLATLTFNVVEAV